MATQKKGINGISKDPNQPQSGSRTMQSKETLRDIPKPALGKKLSSFLKKGGKVKSKKK